ncbi:CD99 molecule isoform X2 [Synchiropus splendidus]|uniref:CD99 molecule isoform X2 n=1 Tax=Synchiropus splendidus TaxID=270530 RepID=UPI00237E36A8|nr:CD99 molecule isoform X2 [Synchiropus splendidus]
MKFVLRIILLAFLLTGTFSQDGFDLGDALDESPKDTQPTQKPKAPEPKNDDTLDLLDAFGPDPAPKKPKEPKSGDGLDLLDAFGPDEPVPEKPKKPKSGGNAGFDLEDALGPDDPKKPAVNPGGGGGGAFSDSDLMDIGGYKPDGGQSSGGNSGYDSNGGAEQPKDPDLPWDQILKLINANMPEEFFLWLANVKQTLFPLLERAMDLLQAVP